MKASGIILAGGQSSRMGQNKALLKLDGKTTIERINNTLQPVFSDRILVANHSNEYKFLNIPIVSDVYPGKGPLAGIHAGLMASPNLINFFVACDMPFISVSLAQYLVEACEDYDAVVPSINGKLHPLFSVFKKNVLPKVEYCLQDDKLRMKDLLDDLKVRIVDENELSNNFPYNLERVFYNMNYPSEYKEAQKWIEK